MSIPLSIPNLSGNELKYVTDCLNSEWVSSEGIYVEKFSPKEVSYDTKESKYYGKQLSFRDIAEKYFNDIKI